MIPPPLAQRVLAWRLHPDERDELIGDLDEQFGRRAAADGPGRARIWYWRQTWVLLWRFSFARRDVVSTPHERRRGLWTADNVATDIRHAWRALRHAPSFALIALLTLTLGIGLSTAVFSMVNGILLKPLPISGADRVVRLGEIEPQHGNPFNGMILGHGAGGPTLADVTIGQWIQTNRTLQALAAHSIGDATVVTPTETLHLSVAEIGGHYFDVLPTIPKLGRLLTPDDDHPLADPVVLVSERLWRQHLGARQDVLGLTITIDDKSAHVIGVLDSSYGFPNPDLDLWRAGQSRWPDPGRARSFMRHFQAVARMRPEATIDQVRVEGQDILQRIADANPAFADMTVAVPKISVTPMLDDMVGPVRPALALLSAGILCVLIAACVNLASLLLSRNTARQRDIAMRLALGATRWRIVRPLLVEQLMLAGAGAGLGTLLGWWMLRVLPHVAPADLPRLNDVRFDALSVAFAATVATVTAVVVGVLPAWQVPSRHLREFAASGQVRAFGRAGSADAVRSGLVVLQVALAAVLIADTALIGRSLIALLQVDPGYRPEGVLTFQVGMPSSMLRQPGRQRQFFTDLEERLRANPRVTAAGHAASLPLHEGGNASSFDIEGRGYSSFDDRPRAHRDGVTRGYFDAIGARLVRGRFFDGHDTPDAEEVVIINDAFATQYFPQADPLGQRLSVRARTYARIVGVVAAARLGPLTADAPPTVFECAEQAPEILGYGFSSGGAGMALRVTGDPLDLAPFIRGQVRAIDPSFPVFNIARLDDELNATFAQPRFFAVTLALFSALAFSTAVLGLYGVLAYAVERRRVEFGIRRALGASERHVVGLVTRRAVLLSLIGLTGGLALAAVGARLLRTLLFGVRPGDPASYAAASVVVAAIVAAASWIPVRRALAIDPAKALRVD